MEFSALLAAHRGLISKFARAYARTPADREELEQEIAAQVWRAYPRFDSTLAKFSTWLYRIALNVAISHARKVRPSGDVDEELVAAEPDPRVAELYSAIHSLPPLERALVLLYLEDRPHAEIAEVLGLSESNVAVKLHRIKQTLRQRIGD